MFSSVGQISLNFMTKVDSFRGKPQQPYSHTSNSPCRLQFFDSVNGFFGWDFDMNDFLATRFQSPTTFWPFSKIKRFQFHLCNDRDMQFVT